MNFYTLTSKSSYSSKKWIFITLMVSMLISAIIFITNYIVDPYNMTKYNLLNIKHKLARDDRRTKLNFFKTQDKFDNILIGSSRVYTINPRVASEILGGTTYNFGVGTASVEDHLGILKYLQKEDKLPKNLIIGIDFYTFNPAIPADRHFLINKELNFLTFSGSSQNELELFFSIDALRASIKTLKHHIRKTDKKPSFDSLGWSGAYINYKIINKDLELNAAKYELAQIGQKFYTDYSYSKLDKKRLEYYAEIKKICKENSIHLYIFTTPLHPLVIKELKGHQETNKALKEFIAFLEDFQNFYNFYEDEIFKTNYDHFAGATHTKQNAGDIILKTLLKK